MKQEVAATIRAIFNASDLASAQQQLSSIVKKLAAKNFSHEEIAEDTGLGLDEIRQILAGK